MTDCPLGKTDVPVIFVKFTAENGFDVFGNVAAVQNGFEA